MDSLTQALIAFLFAAVVAAIGLAIWAFSERRRRIEAEGEACSLAPSYTYITNASPAREQELKNLLADYRAFVKEFHAEQVPTKREIAWGDVYDLPDPDGLVKDALAGLAIVESAQDDSRLIRLVNDLRGTPKEQ